nr:MAG TPA: hypothetical protein [Bacteriophage sp.]
MYISYMETDGTIAQTPGRPVFSGPDFNVKQVILSTVTRLTTICGMNPTRWTELAKSAVPPCWRSAE